MHARTEVRAQYVVEVDPALTVDEELLRVADLQQVGAIEFLVVLTGSLWERNCRDSS